MLICATLHDIFLFYSINFMYTSIYIEHNQIYGSYFKIKYFDLYFSLFFSFLFLVNFYLLT
jgi:hypothetical protein